MISWSDGFGNLLYVSDSFWYRNVFCLFCFGVASLKNRLVFFGEGDESHGEYFFCLCFFFGESMWLV